MEKKVFITVRKDASEAYQNRERIAINWIWAETLAKVEGMRIEVETDYCFKNQFNTVPIKDVSEVGLRLMAIDCEKIEFEGGATYEWYLEKVATWYLEAWNETVTDLPAIKSLIK